MNAEFTLVVHRDVLGRYTKGFLYSNVGMSTIYYKMDDPLSAHDLSEDVHFFEFAGYRVIIRGKVDGLGCKILYDSLRASHRSDTLADLIDASFKVSRG